MTVFDVFVNDRKRCRAGVGSDGVLTAIVNWVRLTGPAARRARQMHAPIEESRLHVGGLRGGKHHSWLERDLEIGDRVTIVIRKAGRADRPAETKAAAPPPKPPTETTLLNVDLDVVSRTRLDDLVEAMTPAAFALFVGKEGAQYTAHLELATVSSDPNRLIRRFVGLIEKLPPKERRTWNRARQREFNLGIQAAAHPHRYGIALAPQTIRAAQSVNASIGFTVYAPMPDGT